MLKTKPLNPLTKHISHASARLDFKYLPALAGYILNESLLDFVKEQLALGRQMDVPALKYFSNFSEEELISFSMRTTREWLTYLAENKAKEQIEDSLKKWVSDRLPQIGKDQVAGDDITLIPYIRKKAMLKYIPAFTSDLNVVLELVNELDLFFLESESASFKMYIDLQQQKINDHLHFIEKITHTTPSIIYVYDEMEQKEIYSNKRIEDLVGYTKEDLENLEVPVGFHLIHPDDLAIVFEHSKRLYKSKDGEICMVECRIKDKKNIYRWMRAYESVFKRTPDGKVWQKIGTAIDIHREKLMADELAQREHQLLEAQELSEMGSFEWNFETHEISATPKLSHILDLQELGNYQEFFKFIHPSDRKKVQQAIDNAVNNNAKYECEYRYNKSGKEKIIWSRGVIFNEANRRVMRGTIMDVTERHHMVKRLQRSDELFNQSQALTHIGNWTWEIQSGNVHWSDELFRIYGLQPQSENISFERFMLFVHPADRERRQKQLEQMLENHQPTEYIMRILLDDGTEKNLQGFSEVLVDEEGKPYKIIGTCQDITERQLTFQKLEESDRRYKQAQALTHIGNWNWELENNKLEWSDEMFHIYGLKPQDPSFSFEKTRSYNHPDDEAFITETLDHALKTKQSTDFIYRIILDDGTKKTVHSKGEIETDEAGNVIRMFGTLQDVTERQNLISKLQKSEDLYKQTEALAKMGNWSWDIQTGKIEWTDQLYRIYDLEPQEEEMTIEKFKSFIHPDDRKFVEEGLERRSVELSQDFTFRIITRKGNEKTIRSIAKIKLNENGEAYRAIGTEQDITEKHFLLKRLQTSEELYKQASVIANLGNWTWNLRDNKVEWSDELYKIFELEPQSVAVDYNLYQSFIHPDDLEHANKCVQESFETLQLDYYYRAILPGQKEKIIHSKAQVKTDDTGKPVLFIGTAQDVTMQKKIEKRLRENQVFIKRITDATPAIITTYNVNLNQYTFVNDGLKKLLGYEPEELIKKGDNFFLNIIHPDDLEDVVQKSLQAMTFANESGQPETAIILELVYRMKNRKGVYRWFHTYKTIFDKNENKIAHLLNISLDITDRIEAEQKVKDQEHFIKHIADASPTVLYLFNTKSARIEYINREVQTILGYSPEEIIAMGDSVIHNLYHPEDVLSIKERLRQYKGKARQTSLFQFECRMKHKEGDWRWLLIREIVFKEDANGMVLEIVGAALDITERRKTESILFQKTLELQQSNARLEEFAYVASHDLKEPLRKISTFGDRLVLTQQHLLQDDGKLYLQKITDASRRMQRLIDDLLSVSMISSEKTFEKYSLQLILEEVLQNLEEEIEEKKAVIHSDHLPEAFIVTSQIRQLFQNLISNSLKFSRKGIAPVINITHKYLSADDVKRYKQLAHAYRYLQIDFADNGIGFEQEFSDKIFNIFQRLHAKSEYEGTGIGLSICKKVIENHGGVIYANTAGISGSDFTILLPLK